MARKRRKSLNSAWIIALIIVLVIVFLANKSADKPAPQQKSLSDLQITACTAAHNAGTCTTNLPELGLVLSEECCEALGKCCQ
ncbi:hypothetical protein HY491_00435 [Candidatus Woesearchaeota archaeon]|nr:hypothetical protein [Candidatus Woesearchaeota archaeon]